MSSFFTMSLIGIIIASLINIFTKSNALTMLLSFASVLLFTGLVAFDTQNLKRTYYSVGGNKDMSVRLGIMGALQLYMDFINIFVNLLQLFGMSNRSRD